MSLKVTRLFADELGETHLEELDLEMAAMSSTFAVDLTELPVTNAQWVEYPEGKPEIMPGLHESPARHLHVCVLGCFEVTTTSGDSKIFGPGDVLLCDDMGSRGHVTKEVGDARRVALALGVPDSWQVPGARAGHDQVAPEGRVVP